MELYLGPTLDSNPSLLSFLQNLGHSVTDIPRSSVAASFFYHATGSQHELSQLASTIKEMPSVPALSIVGSAAPLSIEGQAILNGSQSAIREPFPKALIQQWLDNSKRNEFHKTFLPFFRDDLTEFISFYTLPFFSQFPQNLPFPCNIRIPMTGNIVPLKPRGERFSERELQNLKTAGIEKILVYISDYEAQTTVNRKAA